MVLHDRKATTTARSRRRRLALVVGALAVTAALTVGFLLRPASGPAPAAGPPPALGRAASFWRVLPTSAASTPAAVPPAPADAGSAPAAGLAVFVEDATGGVIAGAAVSLDSGALGATDADGWLRVPSSAAPRTGQISVQARGYAAATTAYANPGKVRVQLLPGSQISGVVVEAGSGRPLPDLTVTAGLVATSTDGAGRFGFRDLAAGVVRLEARGPHHFAALSAPVALGLGKVVTGLRLEAVPAYTISGRVSAEGDPVRGMASVTGAGTEAELDEQGRYQLRGVVPGRYEIKLRGRDAAQFFTLLTPIAVLVVDSDITRDIELGPRTSLTVAVADARGQPLAGQLVEAAQGGEDWRISNRCTTGGDGRCNFFGLTPGSVELEVARGALPARKVTVPAPGPVHFVLDAEGVIEGRLVGADNRPPRQRGLSLRGRKGLRTGATSAADGSFSFSGLPADHYEIEVHDQQGIWHAREPIEAKASVPLGAGERRKDVRIELPPDDGVITGQVLGSRPGGGADAERPLGDVLVTIDVYWPNSFTAAEMAGGQAMMVTKPDGRFAFEGLSRGRRYKLTAHSPDGGRAQTTDLALGSTVTLRLEPLARLSVKLQDRAGQPRAGWVEVVDGEVVVALRHCDHAGDPIHFDALASGRRVVRTRAGGGETTAVVELAPGQLTTVTLNGP